MTATKKSRTRETPRPPRLIEMRVAMRDITPLIWRQIAVPESYSLLQLHRVLQLAFSKLDSHLFEFEIVGERFTMPDDETEATVRDASRTFLSGLGLQPGARFTYLYDFGDDWTHEILVEKVVPMVAPHDVLLPGVIAGAGAAPPEDCGGASGFQEFCTALRDPHHPEHDAYQDWVGPNYDPDIVDIWSLNIVVILAAGWGAI
jgi:hypothetical protein